MSRIIKAADARHTRLHDEARARDAEHARLVAFAFHSPKKIPEFKTVANKSEAPTPGNSEVDVAKLRGFLMAMSKRSD